MGPDGIERTIIEEDEIWGIGTVAERPATGEPGDLWFLVTPNGRIALTRWDGSAWINITASPPATAPTDKAVVRWDDESQLNNSGVLLDDNNALRNVERLALQQISGDVSTPANGEVWYNTISAKFRGRQNDTDVDLVGSGTVPSPTELGQVLYSIDGATFTAQTPMVGDGWLCNNNGTLLVRG
jgi:hypothetical protein